MTEFFRLLQLTDPALPIGGFSHSAGLETYVQQGIVKDKKTTEEFIRAQLSQNIFYTDAAFASLAFDASYSKSLDLLLKLDEECTAIKLPREMREASRKLGLRLLKVFGALQQDELATAYLKAIADNRADGHYCIAFGLLSYAMQVSKQDALRGFFYNAAASMVTNCVKLVPLGQLEGQTILFSLHELMNQLAEQSMAPDQDKIGLCCSGFDIRCMQHERLYSRLYMS